MPLISEGPLTFTTSQIRAIEADANTAFRVGVTYYLWPYAAGKLVAAQPLGISPPRPLVRIGVAISPLTLLIQIAQSPVGDGLTIEPARNYELRAKAISVGGGVLAGEEIQPGAPVYIAATGPSQGLAMNAQADELPTSSLVGVMPMGTDAFQENTVRPICAGEVELEQDEWNAVTGQEAGLTAGAYYYLSATEAGKLTTEPPVDAGTWVMRVGLATSTRTLLVQLGAPVMNVG